MVERKAGKRRRNSLRQRLEGVASDGEKGRCKGRVSACFMQERHRCESRLKLSK